MLLLSEPKAPGGYSFATGEVGTFLDVVDAAQENTRLAWNSNSYKVALEDAYDRRIAAVKEATGQTLENPMRALASADDFRQMASRWRAGGHPVQHYDLLAEQFQRTLARIAESNPDKAGLIRAHVPVIEDAHDLAKASEARLSDVMSRTGGLTGFAGNLAGGFAGSLEDPLTIPTMLIGFSGSASKSLLWNALRAAASNAAGQAVVEPFIQQWRAEAGLEAGLVPGLKDIAFAGAIGGGLDFTVRGLVRGGKYVTGANMPTPPELPRGATIEEAIARLPDDNPIKAAAKGDDAALVVAAQQIEGHLTTAERGALRSLEDDLNLGRADGAKIKIDAGEDLAAIAQAIRHAEDPHVEPMPVHEPVAKVEPVEIDPKDELAVRLSEGRGTAIETAAAFRARPELAAAVPIEGKARTAKSLARLDEPAFDMVRRGAVKESWGALVGDLVADPAEHAPVLERLAERQPERLADARRIIAEETVKPAKPRAISEALGGGEATPVETTLQHVAHAIQSGTVPAKRAREALKRRMATIADDAGPEPAPRGLDEPAGPEAKAEVEAKLKQVKSRLGKGLDQITKETKGGQAAVDRVAGRGGKPKFSLSPAAAAALPDIRAKLNEAAALLPKAVRIRLYDTLTFGQLPERIRALAPAGVEEKTIAGLWDAEEMVIHLSLSTGDPLKTLRHEQVHMMRALGLLTDDDYRRLVRHAEKTDARKTFKIDATYGETIKAQYADKAAREAVLVEETVAHLVAERLAGKPIGGGLDKILKPVRDFLRKIRDALGLKGLRTVDDVFQTIERGGDGGGSARGPLKFSFSSLDMSPEARKARAREMGFDTSTVWYHGTQSTFDAFDLEKSGGAVHFAEHPDLPAYYAYGGSALAGEGKQVLVGGPDWAKVKTLEQTVVRAYEEAQKTGDWTAWKKAKSLAEDARREAASRSSVDKLLAGGSIIPAYVRIKNPLELTPRGEDYNNVKAIKEAIATAKANGNDAIIVNHQSGGKQLVMLDPSNIRSINAAFDPGLDGRNGLLFSLAPDDAEAALGVRLHDADLRDNVAGAARKLSGNVDMQANWIAGMGLEQGDAEEIVKLYTGFLKDFSKIMDASTAKRLAREEVAKLLETEALHRKRVALLQLEATTRVREALSTHKNARGEVDPAQAMIGLLEHYGLEGTPIASSVEGKRKAILGQAHARLEEMIWAFRKTGFTGRRMNVAKMENVVRELFDGGSGDAAAKAFADAWTEVSENLRQRFNRAGGAVGKLEKWGLPQVHDARALRKRGLAQWKADTLALLDPAKMRHPISGQPMTTAQVAESLDVVYRRIVTDGLVDAPAGAGGGRGALHKQHAEHRFLVFKNADAWMKYQKLYGTGGAEGIFAAMMNHVNVMSRDIAAMEVLGPNPGLTLEAMIGFVRKERANAGAGLPAIFPTKSPVGLPWNPETYAASKIQRARDMWAHMHGSANVPVNGFLANTLSAVRNITFATALGSATLSSVTDLGRQQIHRRFAGVFKTAHTGRDLRGATNPMVVLGDVVQQFKSLNRREAVRAGLILESATHVLHESARYAGGFNGPMWSQVFADRMLTWALLTPWTQANRHVFGLSIMAEVADNVGKRFAELDPGLQRLFGRYGMGAAEWDAIRQFTPSVMGDADAFVRGRLPELPPVQPKPIDKSALTSTRARGENTYMLSREAVMQPDPYSEFGVAAKSVDDAIDSKFQMHGIGGSSYEQGLLDLLDNGIDPKRTFHSGPPKGNPQMGGIGSTRTNRPYLVLSDFDEMITAKTGIKNIVLNGPAAANKAALQAAYPNVRFMTVDEAIDFMKARGVTPSRPKTGTQRLQGELMAGSQAGEALDPIRYLKATDIADERLAERYLEMILQETERAVPSGTVANKALWVGQNQPGTMRGELMRSVSMLKSYGTITLMQDWGRMASEIAGGRPLRGARFMAAIAITSTLLGALAMQLKSLSRGEDPRPMNEPQFWGAAMMQGGGMGIYGDYLFGSVNRFGGGFAGSLAGPVTSRASNLWNLTGGNLIQFADDEPTNFGRESVSFARMNLSMPFYLRLAYERVLLDELQKVADPEAYQAFRRKASKLKSQFKTGYWWAPGETGPRRAPDLGNLAP